MATRFVFTDLTETIRLMKATPGELTAEARQILTTLATSAVATIRAAYPLGPTGNLRRGVRSSLVTRGASIVDVQIRSAAPHAFIYERGTVPRYTKGKGRARKYKAGIFRGAMPAGTVLVPTMIKVRARMYGELRALLERAGFKVTGRAA